MNIEIERKFLVKDMSWKEGLKGVHYQQGYLSLDEHRTVRVRMTEERCLLTVKGKTDDYYRLEFEYEIPRKDALVLLHTVCIHPIISKTRYIIAQEELRWEIDEFHKENKGLVTAEIELGYPEQRFCSPAWLGKDVTDDARYYNASLVKNPYQSWKQAGS